MTFHAMQVFPAKWRAVCAELKALGFDHYVPCERIRKRVRDRVEAVERPVWPGYVFVRCGPGDHAELTEIEGVWNFVRVEGRPVEISAWAFWPIFWAEAKGELDHTKEPEKYRPGRGERVRVASGKWKGFLGRVLSVAKRKTIMQLEGGFGGKLTVDTDVLEAA